MRVDRAKHTKRSLRFFKISYGFVAPFHVVVDGPFLFHAAKCSVDVRKALSKLLESTNINLYIADDAMQELEALGDVAEGAMAIARTCTVITGGNADDDNSAESGASRSRKAPSLLNIAKRLLPRLSKGVVVASRVVSRARPAGVALDGSGGGGGRVRLQDMAGPVVAAAQDVKLRERLRRLPGLPTVFLNRNVTVLDAPSEASRAAVGGARAATAGPGELSASDRAAMRRLLQGPEVPAAGSAVAAAAASVGPAGSDSASAPPAKPRKPRVRGVNPLAMKKKLVKPRRRPEEGPDKRPREAAAGGVARETDKAGAARRGSRGSKRSKGKPADGVDPV